MLQGPRVVANVGELEPTGMAQHVRVDREWHLGSLPEALDKPVETDGLAAYMKICALLVPREMKLEHAGGVKAMTEDQIVDAIAAWMFLWPR